jgi:hypothetical protein
MKWFEFLSLLSSYSLRESIGKIGGANHVFRRKNEKYNDVLKFSISGSTEVNDEFMYQGNENKRIFINYEYYGEISVIKNQIFFSKQNTKIWINYNSIKDNNDEIINTEPNIHLDWSYDLLTDNVNCKIDTIKPRKFKDSDIEKYYFENKKVMADFLQRKQTIEHLIVPTKFFPLDYLTAVKEDISYKKAYNINPSSVRSAIDISSQPGVQFDGAGVVSTLYDLKSLMMQGPSDRYFIGRRKTKSEFPIFLKVLSYFKLSDQAIREIDVTIDNFRNEFLLEVEYESESGIYKVPVFLLSDGTVKWLAIVTALATETKSLFIEEPENFLHPKLQENIVEIFREEISNSPHARFALITTHSETLLNKLKPEEIIITSMIDGRTISERVENPEEISRIIADCGFGLGYFYVSGGL